MTSAKVPTPVQPLAYQREAAASLDMSQTTFDRKVRPYIKAIRDGGLVLYPVAELQRWVAENATSIDISEAA
jgi:hypothetical protein